MIIAPSEKHASREILSTKNSIYKKNIGTFPKWKQKKPLSTNQICSENLRNKHYFGPLVLAAL